MTEQQPLSDLLQGKEPLAMPSNFKKEVSFEQMLLEQTTALFTARGERFDDILHDTLNRIGTYLRVDRAYVIRFNDEDQTMGYTHEWCAPEIESSSFRLQKVSLKSFPIMLSELKSTEEILISDVSKLPDNLKAEKEILEKLSVCSALIFPLKSDQRLLGFIGFDSIHPDTVWNHEARGILKFIASNVAVSWENESKRLDLINAMEVASEMAQKAEMASLEKSSFLSNMSHEIRTPMNAVIGVAHLLKNSSLTNVQSRYVDIIQTSSQNILHIINSILDLSKIESGKFKLDHHTFSLEEIFINLNRMFQYPADDKGLTIDYQIDPRIPAFLIGDPVRLQQILTNLISNAVKYSHVGQISVKAQLKDIRDELFWLTFSVSDQGIGLSEEERLHLFDPFWQSAVPTRQTHHGSGLGLAIVKNLCDLMGGTITVSSEVGVGSLFGISLPFTLAKQAAAFKPNLPLSSDDRVLILDDDLSSQRYLARLLYAWSIKSSSCPTIIAAFNLLNTAMNQSHPFTLCIVGHQHLSGDGLERLKQLRNRAPSIHHLFALAEPDSPLFLEQSRWSGIIDGYLSKPIKASVLSDELMIHLGKNPTELPKPLETYPHYRFQQVSLLIVEDIAINREIIRTLLKTFGIEADIARDGVMALEMASQQKYDLILMDVQMPFMDGLEATRRIRQLPDSLKSRVPIIALTAHAMKEDRDACTLAGMNDHVIKPIDPELLYERLAKWLPHRLTPDQIASPGSHKTFNQIMSSGPQASSEIIGSDFFNPDTGLNLLGGNVEIFRSLLRNFIALYSDLPDQMDRLLLDNNQSGLSKICHNLKSTAGHSGSSILSLQAHELNQIVKTGAWPPTDETQGLLRQFGLDVIFLLKVITHYLDTVDQPVPSEPRTQVKAPNQDCFAALRQLNKFLVEHNPLACRDCIQKLMETGCPKVTKDILNRIGKHLNLYQFESAIQILDQFMKKYSTESQINSGMGE